MVQKNETGVGAAYIDVDNKNTTPNFNNAQKQKASVFTAELIAIKETPCHMYYHDRESLLLQTTENSMHNAIPSSRDKCSRIYRN